MGSEIWLGSEDSNLVARSFGAFGQAETPTVSLRHAACIWTSRWSEWPDWLLQMAKPV